MKLAIAGDGFLGRSLGEYFSLGDTPMDVQESLKRTHLLGERGRQILSNYFNDSGVDIFINAAGPSSVHDSFMHSDLYESEPRKQVQAHLDFLSQLKHVPHYVFVSSAAVYGESPFTGSKEEDLCNPLSPYGIGKLKAEEYLTAQADTYPGKIIVLRIFSAYGNLLKKQIPYVIATQIRSTSELSLFGTGSERRDFIHVSDVGFALSRILNSLKLDSISTYNVGSGSSTSINELDLMANNSWLKLGNPKVEITFKNMSKEGDPVHLTADISKLSKIDFAPMISPEKGLTSYFMDILR